MPTPETSIVDHIFLLSSHKKLYYLDPSFKNNALKANFYFLTVLTIVEKINCEIN